MPIKSNGVLFGLLVIFSACLLLISGILAYTTLIKTKPVITTNQTRESKNAANSKPTSQTQADETAGWKTYTNAKSGYSFNYPQEWSASINSSGDALETVTLKLIDKAQPRFEYLPTSIVDVSYEVDFQIYDVKNDPSKGELSSANDINVFVLDGIKGIKYGAITQYPIPLPVVRVTKGDKTYRIVYSAFAPEDTFTKYQKTFDQILSTFKFTDNTSTKLSGTDNSCLTDSDCGLNSCQCQAYPKAKLTPAQMSCTRYCPGTPECQSGKCVLVE